MTKTLPFTKPQIEAITKEHPTPFYLYDEAGIRESARALVKAFDFAKDFTNYFAVKALPNPRILSMLKEEGMGVDCSSLTELMLAERVGFRGEEIMFTANDVPAEEFKKARALEAIINLDDVSHVEFLEQTAGISDYISFRYNPGPAREGNVLIGRPEEAKFGATKAQMIEGYRLAKEKGAKRFGLHTMVASNELDPAYLIETANMQFELADEISRAVGIEFELINFGGGIGIPYLPEQTPFDLAAFGAGVKAGYEKYVTTHPAPALAMECGRFITGPHGYLVSTVLHHKDTYKQYVGLDAAMQNLMRPGMYGAYHHLTVLGKEGAPANRVYDVTGSLCENNDKFAVDRPLPEVAIGDLVVFHDAGAHGHSMGFNYNGKLRSAELLLKTDGEVELIRRAETPDDYFATLNQL